MKDDWTDKNKISKATTCPFCKVETDKIVITPMNSASAYITADCCGMDAEVIWNEGLEKKFGKIVMKPDSDEEWILEE